MKMDIRTLDLNLLKTLDALLDERSVSRAASRLSLTPSAHLKRRDINGVL